MRLSTILGRFGEVVEEGDGYVATCPAHADSHASLRVAISSDTGSILIKCRAGCETRAVLDAVGLSFGDLFTPDVDVRVRVATAGSGEVPLEDQAQMMAYLASCAKRIYDPLVAEYLQRRFGVSVELAERLGLGFDPGGGVESFHLLGAVHHQVPRLVVPFRDVGGVPRGFQARALPYHKVRWSGPTNPPDGGSWTKIGFFPSGSGMDYVVVCEGPGDALTSCAAGVDAVGIRGASLGPNAAELLAGSMEGRRLILAGDADRAGREMNEKLAERLTGLGFEVRILDIPEPFGDLSE